MCRARVAKRYFRAPPTNLRLRRAELGASGAGKPAPWFQVGWTESEEEKRVADELSARYARAVRRAGTCAYPGCEARCYVERETGRIHDFCSRTHAKAAGALKEKKELGQAPADETKEVSSEAAVAEQEAAEKPTAMPGARSTGPSWMGSAGRLIEEGPPATFGTAPGPGTMCAKVGCNRVGSVLVAPRFGTSEVRPFVYCTEVHASADQARREMIEAMAAVTHPGAKDPVTASLSKDPAASAAALEALDVDPKKKVGSVTAAEEPVAMTDAELLEIDVASGEYPSPMPVEEAAGTKTKEAALVETPTVEITGAGRGTPSTRSMAATPAYAWMGPAAKLVTPNTGAEQKDKKHDEEKDEVAGGEDEQEKDAAGEEDKGLKKKAKGKATFGRAKSMGGGKETIRLVKTADSSELPGITGEGLTAEHGGKVLAKRAAELANFNDEARLKAALLCMRGECEHKQNWDVLCDCCGAAGLHLLQCAGMGKQASLGNLLCTDCRLGEMGAMPSATKETGPLKMTFQLKETTELALLQLIKKKETTMRNNLSFEKLRTDFMKEMLKDGGAMAEPGESANSTALMIFWIVKSGRGSSLKSILINMASYFEATGKKEVMSHPVVRAAIEKATEMNPGRSLPKTTGSPLLVRYFLEAVKEEAFTEFIAARDSLLGALEVMAGQRVGELAGAQVGHGLFANHLSLVTWVGGEGLIAPPHVEEGDVFVEHMVETSKTEHERVVCVRGTSRGVAAVQLERYVRDYWRIMDFHMAPVTTAGGWKVERPDFWVAQVSVQGLRADATRRTQLKEWFGESSLPQVTSRASFYEGEMKRLLGKEQPKEAEMFLNVAFGPLHGPVLDRAVSELKARNIPCTVAKGPMLTKQAGVEKGWGADGRKVSITSAMPILTASTYSLLKRALDKAYEMMKAEGKVDLQLGGERTEPSWGHYTWRRLAAEFAQACLARGDCKEEDVDLHMGWRLAKWSKQMRLHYSDRGVRTSRAHLTELI